MDTQQGAHFLSDEKTVTGAAPVGAAAAPTKTLEVVLVTPLAYERGWDGDIFDCGGRAGHCDGQAWNTVCLTIWCPCVVLGLNMRRAFRESAWAHSIAFFIILIGAPIAIVTTFYVYLYRSAIPKINQAVADDSLDELNAAVNYIYYMEIIFYVVACTCAVIGVVYGCAMRMRIIKKYHIREGSCTAFCCWWWCTSCALCQERRTLLTHVDEYTGVWSDSPQTVPPPQETQLAATKPPVPANMDNYCAV